MDRPMIGILPLMDQEKDSYWMLPGYMEGVIKAGGTPVMLPLTSDFKMLGQFLDQYDGFLFTGGQDISPELYGERPLPSCGERCKRRDEMERALFQMAFKRDKPILGICRGIQLINVLLGGTLYQDLPSQNASRTGHRQSPPYDRPAHEVRIVEGTPLCRLLNKKTIAVNSYHHQAIRKLSPRLCAAAYSADGLAEAVYAPGKRYVWAVQWHPEFSFQKDQSSLQIFESFVSAATAGNEAV